MTLKGSDYIELTAVDYDPFADEALARVVPTTEPQREVWLADHLGSEASLAYNQSICLRFFGPLHIDALRQALQDLVQRHEALRATISADGEEFCIAGDMTLGVPLMDSSTLDAAEQETAIAAARLRAVETPFDLERGPLFRAEILKLATDSHILIITVHHIVCDGWSIGVLVRDLAALYALRIGISAESLEAPASFGDYAVAQGVAAGGAESTAAEEYWLPQFSGTVPTLDLPLDHPRKVWRTFTSKREDSVLDASLVSDIRKLAACNGASLFAALLAGFAALLQRVTSADDLVIGIPAAGQSLAGLDNLVGHCVNLLPLRIAVNPSTTMNEVVAGTQTAVLDAYDHQQYTFGTLLRNLAIERDSSRLPLVSVIFNMDQELDANASGFPDVAVEFSSNPRSFENFELFVNAAQVKGTLRLECQYNTDLFDGATIRRWLACYETLLRRACVSAGDTVASLELISSDERKLLSQWNSTAQAFSRTSLVHELVEAQASKAPQHPAVTYQGTTINYGDLDVRANRIARSLRAKGVGRGSLVGLYVERGPDMVAALLGVLKAGAAYVPLDPSYPVERLRFMADDAELSVLVAEQSLASPLAWPHERTLHLDAADIAAQSGDPLPRDESSAGPQDAAYVIFTSGSTGKPKGVQVPHRAVVNFLESMAQEPGLSEQDRLVAVTTLSFDIAVNELLLPLACGAEIMLAARDEVMDGALLRKLVEDSRATTMQATPATWRLLIGAGWQGSAGFKALCGGEPLRLDLAQQLLERTGQLWNMYGPTETTVWSTCWHVEHPERGIVIGRPIANTQVWVLDEQRQLCPIGVPGEIWIGGDGVTLGYLNQPELTAARFVADPFSTGPGARLYRTGDCGRWRADGQLEHLGRLDFQVKVRGYRIELGEIEACVASYPDVVSAVVTTREDRPGDVRLVAYVVARTASKISDDALKAHLKKTLPEYMIPQHVVAVPAIPLLPNGKVDRKALPAPDTAAKPSREYVAARTDLEKLVVAAMESILSLPGVGIYDSFFMLGGHSLLAAQLASRLGRTLGIHVPMRTLFEAPSPEQLAKWIAAQLKVGDAAAWSIPRRPDRDKAPLSLMQQRVWFMEQLDPGRAVYNMPSAHRLRGKLDEAAFTAAFAAMVQRQDALRTVIAVVDETPMQLILPEVAFQLLPATDLRSLPSHDREQGLLDRLQALAGTLFDLGQAPLFHAELFRLAEEEYAFFFMTHHIIGDGWSFDIFYQEMATLYEAFRHQRPSPLSDLPISYGDFAAWQRDWMQGEELATQVGYWKARLAGQIEPLAIPTDHPRPAVMSGNGYTVWMSLPTSTLDRARALGLRANATLFMSMLATYVLMLHQLTGQREIMVGVPVRGRDMAELEPIMGFFVNVLPLRIRVAEDATFVQLLEEVRDCVLDAFKYPDVPFDHLVRELNVPRDRSRFPLYQAMFSYQDARQRIRHWDNLDHEMIQVMQPGVAEDIGLWFLERTEDLIGVFKFSQDIMTEETAQLLSDRFVHLVNVAFAEPDTPISRLPLPEYMVPGDYVALERLPISPNGKIDRKALPAPARSEEASTTSDIYVASRNETERKLVGIFSRVLGFLYRTLC